MTTQDSNNQGTGDPTVTPFRDVNAETMQRRIADDLRQARVSRGLEIREAAESLRIRAVFLQALEDGRFGDLPGPTYVAGFLRTYGDALGVDGEELVRRYKDDTGGVLAKQRLNFPVPASEARQPTGAIILVTLILGLAVFGAWYVYKEGMLVDLELVPGVPETIEMGGAGVADAGVDAPDEPMEIEAEAQNADAVSDNASGASVEEEPLPAEPAENAGETMFATAEAEVMDAIGADADAVDGPAEDLTDGGAVLPVEPAAADAPAAEELMVSDAVGEDAAGTDNALAETEVLLNENSGYVPRVYGRTNADARVEIRAVEETWIQVEAADNEILLTRVLLPGDVYRVPNRSDVVLDTGNAGGLEVKVDGEVVGVLGESGVVVRNVSLAAENLLSR
jgi:cytoskeleton protein RodZ